MRLVDPDDDDTTDVDEVCGIWADRYDAAGKVGAEYGGSCGVGKVRGGLGKSVLMDKRGATATGPGVWLWEMGIGYVD